MDKIYAYYLFIRYMDKKIEYVHKLFGYTYLLDVIKHMCYINFVKKH